MELGEAFEKVTLELHDQVHRLVDPDWNGEHDEEGEQNPPTEEERDLIKQALAKYTFDETVNSFVDQRSEKFAHAQISEMSVDTIRRCLHEDGYLALFLDDKFEKDYIPDIMKLFALGYAFAAPEHRATPRTKEGFLTLSKDVDRSVVDVLVKRFLGDYLLIEKITHRLRFAANYTSSMFESMNKSVSKRSLTQFFEVIHSMISMDCFVAGVRIRDLLEEEVAFETMMKEME